MFILKQAGPPWFGFRPPRERSDMERRQCDMEHRKIEIEKVKQDINLEKDKEMKKILRRFG